MSGGLTLADLELFVEKGPWPLIPPPGPDAVWRRYNTSEGGRWALQTGSGPDCVIHVQVRESTVEGWLEGYRMGCSGVAGGEGARQLPPGWAPSDTDCDGDDPEVAVEDRPIRAPEDAAIWGIWSTIHRRLRSFEGRFRVYGRRAEADWICESVLGQRVVRLYWPRDCDGPVDTTTYDFLE